MRNFREFLEEIFYEHCHSSSFHVPLSMKELKVFTEKVCSQTYKELSNEKLLSSLRTNSDWTSSETDLNTQNKPETKNDKTAKKNYPIGLNSLNQTFNILQIVGQGIKIL